MKVLLLLASIILLSNAQAPTFKIAGPIQEIPASNLQYSLKAKSCRLTALLKLTDVTAQQDANGNYRIQFPSRQLNMILTVLEFSFKKTPKVAAVCIKPVPK